MTKEQHDKPRSAEKLVARMDDVIGELARGTEMTQREARAQYGTVAALLVISDAVQHQEDCPHGDTTMTNEQHDKPRGSDQADRIIALSLYFARALGHTTTRGNTSAWDDPKPMGRLEAVQRYGHLAARALASEELAGIAEVIHNKRV